MHEKAGLVVFIFGIVFSACNSGHNETSSMTDTLSTIEILDPEAKTFFQKNRMSRFWLRVLNG